MYDDVIETRVAGESLYIYRERRECTRHTRHTHTHTDPISGRARLRTHMVPVCPHGPRARSPLSLRTRALMVFVREAPRGGRLRRRQRRQQPECSSRRGARWRTGTACPVRDSQSLSRIAATAAAAATAEQHCLVAAAAVNFATVRRHKYLNFEIVLFRCGGVCATRFVSCTLRRAR